MTVRRHFPRVAFVLSGCCGLAASHVGMLRALADHLIEPDVVIGSSIGALNGAAYAQHPTLAGLARLEHAWSTTTGIDLPPPGSPHRHHGNGASDGEVRSGLDAVDELTRRALTAAWFDQLKVPFHCVARVGSAGPARWFSAGPLLHAIYASTTSIAVSAADRVPSPSLLPAEAALHPAGKARRGRCASELVDDLPLRRATDLGARTIFVLDEAGPVGVPAERDHRSVDSAIDAHQVARRCRLQWELHMAPSDVQVLVMPNGLPSRGSKHGETKALIDAAFEACQTLLDRADLV